MTMSPTNIPLGVPLRRGVSAEPPTSRLAAEARRVYDRSAGNAMMILVRSILSILILPTTVALVIPSAIVSDRGLSLAALWPATAAELAASGGGIVLVAIGLVLIVATVWQFGVLGRGTLAPWDPPKRLVVVGLYRYVRNPMISGVALVLLGEAACLRVTGIVVWSLCFVAVNALYIPLIEEPGLERRFGEDYRTYRRNVPRWVARRSAWTPPWEHERERGADLDRA